MNRRKELQSRHKTQKGCLLCFELQILVWIFSDFQFDGFSIQFKGRHFQPLIHNNQQGVKIKYLDNQKILFNIGQVYVHKTFVNPQTLDYAKIESRDGGLIEADIQNFCYPPPVLLLHPLTPYVITGTLLSDMETLHYYFVFIDQVAKL